MTTLRQTKSERARAHKVQILDANNDKYAAKAIINGLECVVMDSSTNSDYDDASRISKEAAAQAALRGTTFYGCGSSRQEASNDFLCASPILMNNFFSSLASERCIIPNSNNIRKNSANAYDDATDIQASSPRSISCGNACSKNQILEELKGMGIDNSSIIDEYYNNDTNNNGSVSSAASSTEPVSGVSCNHHHHHHKNNNNADDDDDWDYDSPPPQLTLNSWYFGEKKKKKGWRRIPFWLLVTLGVIGVLIIVIIILVLVSRFLNSDAEESKPQQRPGQEELSPRDYLSIEDYILTLLPNYTLESMNVGTLPSPQTLAYNWLLNDPFVETYPDWRIVQRYAMGALYYSMGGNRTWQDETKWMSYEHHENDWFWSLSFARHEFQNFPFDPVDFLRQDIYDEVIHLWLFNNSLSGTIPPEIGLLTHLKSIDLVGNKLGGSIPTQINKLEKLMGLFVSVNQLSGTIPTLVGNLHNLLWLSASQNKLTGSLPSEVGMLPLWSLQLDENELAGSIPSDLGRLSDVLYLRLQDNSLSGSIPSHVGQMSALQMVDISQNDLTGPLPSELGSFQMANLDLSFYLQQAKQSIVLDLKFVRSFNNAVEEAVHKLNGNSLQLQGNRLTGRIPSELAQLSFNGLQHCVSYILGDNFKCNGVDLHNNLLSGGLPLLLSESLEYFDVSSNTLTGSIPEEIIQWSSLRVFNASFNQLTGSIPAPSIYSLATSNESTPLDFQVSGNSMLTGSVPVELCTLPSVNISFTCSDFLCGCSCICRQGSA